MAAGMEANRLEPDDDAGFAALSTLCECGLAGASCSLESCLESCLESFLWSCGLYS